MNPRNFLFALGAALLFGLAPAPLLRAQNDQDDASPPSKPLRALSHSTRSGSHGDDQVIIAGENIVASDQQVGDAVSVMGPLTVDGHCTGDAVAIMGRNTINGTVDQDVVCVMGDLTLGPKAHIGHDVVCVMGSLHRDPAAFVGGSVVHELGFGPHFTGMHNWWLAGLSHGRLLPMGPHVEWIWLMNLLLLGVYALMAMLFPTGIRRTGDMLVEHPVQVILSGFLAMLGLPVLFILLLVTVVGIPVAIILLPIALFLLVYFGKASLYGLIGRKITGERAALPLAVLIGGLIALLILMVPFVCFAFYFFASYLGFGCALTALLQGRKRPPASSVASSPLVVPPSYPSPLEAQSASVSAGAVDAGFVPPPAPAPVPPPSPEPVPLPPASEPFRAAPAGVPLPPLIDATLTRANLWIRAGAMAIDVVIIAVAAHVLSNPFISFQFGPPHTHDGGPGPFLILLAAYAAVMWKLKGTTIGGLICHLQVVRLDGRPLDWPTAIVRALGCFVSLCALGLGFIWVAFDPERQSWHDKLAGTTVVISVTRRSLV